ncbi:ACT domain-containing protein [Octadecabacter sp. 1_MG-2023]|uniref:ACT domain-containing protein n=1 Tax=unclassified Octadecabacter TaxID=196158 RepID=UPI001C08C97A|nr:MULTISPECIES: ACT domain-containing protein [unclassified Octadecabacter]MBU2992521.1 ACT domain-containing protein [Octadecabacter sp. B2R22]MDO6734722.1 ACT domain-containing protein [Octadecabacter sp. 1_MG-2023]
MKLSFSTLTGGYSICRLPADAPLPNWAEGAGLVSITRAEDELSIVCLSERAPTDADHGWCALRVDTLAELDEPGVVMAAVAPISSAGLGVFVISTHLRDYLLVRMVETDRARAALIGAGHVFT